MSEVDDYRANLATCQCMAAKSSDAVEKRAWLHMAETWRVLIICREEFPVGKAGHGWRAGELTNAD